MKILKPATKSSLGCSQDWCHICGPLDIGFDSNYMLTHNITEIQL